MKTIAKTVFVLLLVLGVVAHFNQVRVELVEVDEESFCMYMNSYSSDELGLINCFNGDAHSVNEVNDQLTEHMRQEMPVISLNE